ncbi:MAG: phosphatidate cytidylyltransferase [Candidatus Rokubacteria bacterium]|nr:phosphatidate cytidylyltransferase [Candidatus Rokubacteria bacterium]MBI3827203.1 phosphatidate cytidylyltransferase [Candidatus Rokubacteria bacterium]
MIPVLKRALTAIVGVPLVICLFTVAPGWLGRHGVWLVVGVVMLVAGIGAWELTTLFLRAGRPVHRGLATVLAVLVTASFVDPTTPIRIMTVALAFTLAVPLLQPSRASFEPSAYTLLAIAYLGWPLGHALRLYALPGGPWLLVYVLLVTWAGETAAYVFGSLLGRTPLAPQISPRKTLEGAVAQIGLSAIVAIVLSPWVVPGWSLSTALGAGLVLGVVGQVGDLVESVIKRTMGAKDAGTLFPGHGGMLDRIDSLLFNVPAFFYYAAVVGVRA